MVTNCKNNITVTNLNSKMISCNSLGHQHDIACVAQMVFFSLHGVVTGQWFVLMGSTI